MDQDSQPHDDQQGESAQNTNSDWDSSGNPTDAAPEGGPKTAAGREMLVQLQQMIDTITTQATPVVRDVAAKAAELAAVAGQKAGPLAYKAAEVTESLGQKMAARSKDFAAEMRRSPEDTGTPQDASPQDTSPQDAQAQPEPTAEAPAADEGPDDRPATDSSAWS